MQTAAQHWPECPEAGGGHTISSHSSGTFWEEQSIQATQTWGQDKGAGRLERAAHTWSQTHLVWTWAPRCPHTLLLRGTQPTLDSECPGARAGAGRPEGDTQIRDTPQGGAQVEHRHTDGGTHSCLFSVWLEEPVTKNRWKNWRGCWEVGGGAEGVPDWRS